MASRRSLLAAPLGGLALLPATARAEPPLVVASNSILGDFVRQLAGPRVTLRVLMGPEVDPHDFSPRPSDAGAVQGAALLVRNGLGLEPWLDRLLRSSRPRGTVLTLGDGITPLPLGRGQGPDPHAWLDPQNAMAYARALGAALAALGAAPETAAWLERLAVLDGWMAAQFAAVPAERRVFVVGHAGLGYLARRFGLTVLAPQGHSHAGQAAASQVAQLVQEVRARRLRALFSIGPPDAALMRRVAAETGVPLAGRLYVETLSAPEGPAPDYEAMLRHDTALLVAAMQA